MYAETSPDAEKALSWPNIQTHLDGMRNKPDMVPARQALPLPNVVRKACGV